jgi:16S rRNA (adenine1518-N6/adenine1519-N6)-dimethyltransferase
MTPETLPPLKDTIRQHGLDARKALGQHFLLDSRITDRIVVYAGDMKEHHLIEVGPGPGGLTRSLLAAGAKSVTVVEKDERCLAIMSELAMAYGADRMHILHEDATKTDLVAAVPAPRKIVANLPYNVGTLMLLNWLDDIYKHGPSAYTSLTLMFQKEVAERIVAAPGDGADYGRLSVICQFLCECRYDMELPPGAFSPPPKVSSAVVTLTPRAKPLSPISKEVLERVVAAAFGQRRKMLRGALKSLGVDTEALLKAANVDGTRRAETLDVPTLCRLAEAYVSLCGAAKSSGRS